MTERVKLASAQGKRSSLKLPGLQPEQESGGGGEDAHSNEIASYASRPLACTMCGAEQETKWMQLKVREGFRALHCESCGKQERTTRNPCQCKAVWHQCPIHRVDPPVHRSRKAAKRKNEERDESTKKRTLLSSSRQAPDVPDDSPLTKKTSSRKRSSQQNEDCLKNARFQPSHYPPRSELLQRIRLKEAKRKAGASAEGETPSKQSTAAATNKGSAERKEADVTSTHNRSYTVTASIQQGTTRSSMRRELEQKIDDQRNQLKRQRLEHACTNSEANENPKCRSAEGEGANQGRTFDRRAFVTGSAKINDKEFNALTAILKK